MRIASMYSITPGTTPVIIVKKAKASRKILASTFQCSAAPPSTPATILSSRLRYSFRRSSVIRVTLDKCRKHSDYRHQPLVHRVRRQAELLERRCSEQRDASRVSED